jgi:hypothetical protein
MFRGKRGPEREEFVTARIAAERREAKETAKEGEEAGDMFRGDTAKFGVAAVATVSVKGEAEGYRAGVETLFAGFAAPGKNVERTKEIVGERAPLGATDAGGAAVWTGDGQDVGHGTGQREKERAGEPMPGGQHRGSWGRWARGSGGIGTCLPL